MKNASQRMGDLKGKRVAILVADGYEQSELEEPKKALEAANAETVIVSPNRREVKGWQHTNWGKSLPVDQFLGDADPAEFDALVLPGGVMNPDKLRINEDAIAFIRHFGEEGKPIAAICHGPWTLINAGLANGRRMTSYKSLEFDLANAGAAWSDEEVVVDNGIVTSREPKDLPAFCAKMIEEIAEGHHEDKQIPSEKSASM